MVSAALARERGHSLHALTIDYGQRHIRELQSARAIAEKLGVERHVELPLDLRQFGGSALTADIEVPKGGVAENIPVTYVPARNLVFLALTTAFAETSASRDIFIGVNALDYSGYPDCRPEFIASFAETARLGTKQGVEGDPFTIHAPLQFMTRRISRGNVIGWALIRHGVGLAMTRHRMGSPAVCAIPAGLRRKGFAEAELVDTTPYARDIDD